MDKNSDLSVDCRPVLHEYRQGGGRSPSTDGVRPAPRPAMSHLHGSRKGKRERAREWWTKWSSGGGASEWWTKRKLIAAGVGVVLLILLIVVLPIALTLSHRNAKAEKAVTNNATDPAALFANFSKITKDSVQLQYPEGATTIVPAVILDDFELDSVPEGPPRKIPPVVQCKEDGFICEEDGSRLSVDRVCDGFPDCLRGSDESKCLECKTSLWCDAEEGGGLRCLQGEQLCDRHHDCTDKTDEDKYCELATCKEGEYECEPSTGGGLHVCIPHAWKCDGDSHCPMDDDETDCSEAACRGNSTWCEADQRCIPAWNLCDGNPNCGDGSDEEGCGCDKCAGPELVLCGRNGTCIGRGQVCDGFSDCPADEDELNCPGWCPLDEVPAMRLCADGRRYPLRYACSGLVEACQGACDSCDPEVAFTCTRQGDGPKCVPRRVLCDGVVNCEDGSDEAGSLCGCSAVAGPVPPFVCPPSPRELARGLVAHTKCIPASRRCDGFSDCPDESDEANCTTCANLVPGFESFHCGPTNKCLPSTARCDGIVDCPDYTDEDACPCTQCKSQSYATYMCSEGGRCLRATYICNPNSPHHCPGEHAEDQAHCSESFDPLHQ